MAAPSRLALNPLQEFADGFFVAPPLQMNEIPAAGLHDIRGERGDEIAVGNIPLDHLDRFWNEFAGNPSKLDEAMRNHYAALYARPGAMRAAFAQFRSIRQDTEDNRKSMATKLRMPVLAIGGEKSFGENEAIVMRNAAVDVTGVVIPDAGHWLMEEQPAATVSTVRKFIDKK